MKDINHPYIYKNKFPEIYYIYNMLKNIIYIMETLVFIDIFNENEKITIFDYLDTNIDNQ